MFQKTEVEIQYRGYCQIIPDLYMKGVEIPLQIQDLFQIVRIEIIEIIEGVVLVGVNTFNLSGPVA